MGNFKNKVGKLKEWMIQDDESNEEYDGYDEEYSDYDDVDDGYGDTYDEETTEKQSTYSGFSQSRVSGLHIRSNVKIVISIPKLWDDAQVIADNLKSNCTVIVNLNDIEDNELKHGIFNFLNGAVYVVDGSIKHISKGIYVLAPNGVEIDKSLKEELESKPIFPWQTNK